MTPPHTGEYDEYRIVYCNKCADALSDSEEFEGCLEEVLEQKDRAVTMSASDDPVSWFEAILERAEAELQGPPDTGWCCFAYF
jgi:hypothetical protein